MLYKHLGKGAGRQNTHFNLFDFSPFSFLYSVHEWPCFLYPMGNFGRNLGFRNEGPAFGTTSPPCVNEAPSSALCYYYKALTGLSRTLPGSWDHVPRRSPHTSDSSYSALNPPDLPKCLMQMLRIRQKYNTGSKGAQLLLYTMPDSPVHTDSATK